MVWQAQAVDAGGLVTVAIKTIRPELASDATFKTMFVDEARMSSRLVHENVARVLDVGEDAGAVFIVFEWVEGTSLEGMCEKAEARGEAVPTAAAIRVVADVCAGLHALHELKGDANALLHAVHRDVSPSNVLVGADGSAKLIDLGIAKARDRAGAPTRSGIAKGTPQFMAPEQAMGQPVDRRADVFGAGAILYRVLAGHPPFADSDALAAFVMGRPPRALPVDVPAPLSAVVLKAMCSDPEGRYETAAEMRRALVEAATAANLDAFDASLTPPDALGRGRATTATRRLPWLWIAMTLAALLAVAAIALALAA